MSTLELVTLLQAKAAKYGDILVETTWEGITRDIETKNVYANKLGDRNDGQQVLFIDADKNSYKAEYALDPQEGEMNTKDGTT